MRPDRYPLCFYEFLTLFLPLIAASIHPDDVVFLDPQTFTDVPRGRSRTADLVARIHPLSAADGPEAVLFHTEVQSQPDPTRDAQMWEYNAGLRQRHGRFAISAALLPFGPVVGVRGVAKVRYVETVFGDDYILLEYWQIGLRDLAADAYVATGSPLAVALAALMRPQPGPEGRANLKIAIVRRLRDSGLDDARLFLLVNLVETYLVLDAAARAEGARALLDHVGQFVREEVLPRRAMRLVRARAEEDVRAHGKGDGCHAPAESVGLGVGVDAYVAEAHLEHALHALTDRGLQWLTTTALRLNAPGQRRAERAALPAHLDPFASDHRAGAIALAWIIHEHSGLTRLAVSG